MNWNILNLFAVLATVGETAHPHANFGNCTAIKVEQLDAHPEDCSSSSLTADCMSKIDVKGISHSCLDKLSEKTLQDMEAKSVGEITEGPKENLPMSVKFWHPMLNKFSHWKDAPKIIEKIVGDADLFGKLLEDTSVPRNLISHLLTEDSVVKLQAAQCGKLSAGLARSMDAKAFKKVTKGCFSSIKPDFFSGLSADFFENINPIVFEVITAEQAEKIPVVAVKNMTEEQAKNWGPEPKLPKIDPDASKTVQTKERAALQKYIDEHPCSKVEKWMDSTPDKTKRALHRRCDHVIHGNYATSVESSSMTGLLIATVVLITFIA